ncbi:MAG: hypothetical protein D6743_13660 [Calditrichaeota bacterium]|nr:MAG: hypothetical protein D6743_13660 [Calditrichota bacterium]
MAALFLITAGDETQGLLSRPHAFYQILRRIQIELVPYEIVFGVGYGTLTTEIGTHAVGADGPAFHRARDALEQAKAERKAYGKSLLREVRLHSGDALRDTVLNAMFLALSVLKSGWSEKQRRILNRLELGATPKAIAAQLQVPLSNISRTVDSAHFREFEILVDSLVTFSRNSFSGAESK